MDPVEPGPISIVCNECGEPISVGNICANCALAGWLNE